MPFSKVFFISVICGTVFVYDGSMWGQRWRTNSQSASNDPNLSMFEHLSLAVICVLVFHPIKPLSRSNRWWICGKMAVIRVLRHSRHSLAPDFSVPPHAGFLEITIRSNDRQVHGGLVAIWRGLSSVMTPLLPPSFLMDQQLANDTEVVGDLQSFERLNYCLNSSLVCHPFNIASTCQCLKADGSSVISQCCCSCERPLS